MDGRVGAIRAELDAEGFAETPILAYSAKFASAFYGPFREAAGSTPAFGDRRGYQMDPANGREALREALLDMQEGADMVMVKPALAYLDVIARSSAPRACRWRPTTSAASMRWSRPPPPPATSTSAPPSRDTHRAPPRRRRHDHHLPRQGRRPMARRVELTEEASRPPSAEPATAPAPRFPRRARARTAPPSRSTISTASC